MHSRSSIWSWFDSFMTHLSFCLSSPETEVRFVPNGQHLSLSLLMSAQVGFQTDQYGRVHSVLDRALSYTTAIMLDCKFIVSINNNQFIYCASLISVSTRGPVLHRYQMVSPSVIIECTMHVIWASSIKMSKILQVGWHLILSEPFKWLVAVIVWSAVGGMILLKQTIDKLVVIRYSLSTL